MRDFSGVTFVVVCVNKAGFKVYSILCGGRFLPKNLSQSVVATKVLSQGPVLLFSVLLLRKSSPLVVTTTVFYSLCV